MFVEGMHKYWVPEREPTPDFELPGLSGFRYRQDYYATLTDLYVHNHIAVLQAWAKTHDMRFRSQVAFGNSFDVMRSAREITRRGGLADDESLNAGDLPPFDLSVRDWHFAFDHYRSIAGGAHQGGETQIGSELGAVFVRELMISLPEYKRAMDKQWAAGLTRPLIHGMTHQAQGATWPGTDRFAGLVSDSWNHRTFPQWAMWKPLADYWARGAMVLEHGHPRTDVAVYRNGFVTTAATIVGELPEIINYQAADVPQALRDAANDQVAARNAPRPSRFFDTDALEQAGFTVEYVDPVGLAEPQARGEGVLYPNGPAYRAVVIDERAIPGATAAALDRASAAGLRVVFVGELPNRGTSARDAAEEDQIVKRSVRRILGRKTARQVRSQGDVAEALRDLAVRPAAEWSRPIRVYSQRRETDHATYYYVWNPADEAVRFSADFLAAGVPSRLDLWTGEITREAVYRDLGDRVRVPLALGPGEATVIAFRKLAERRAHVVSAPADDIVARGDEVEVRSREGGTVALQLSDGSLREVRVPAPPSGTLPVANWSLHVDEVGPEGNRAQDVVLVGGLRDWREIPQIADSSGTGTYTATVNLTPDWTAAQRGALLDLGRIEGAAQVFVNDRLATPDVLPREPVDVSALLKPGDNKIRVVLTTTLKNRAVARLPIVLLSRPAFASQPGTQPYGLIGPVQLIPYGRTSTTLPLLRGAGSTQRLPRLKLNFSRPGGAANRFDRSRTMTIRAIARAGAVREVSAVLSRRVGRRLTVVGRTRKPITVRRTRTLIPIRLTKRLTRGTYILILTGRNPDGRRGRASAILRLK
jgi:hypothetical protein